MKTLISAVALMATLFAGGVACAQDEEGGPYYPTPGLYGAVLDDIMNNDGQNTGEIIGNTEYGRLTGQGTEPDPAPEPAPEPQPAPETYPDVPPAVLMQNPDAPW